MKIFLTYASEDKDTAEQVYLALVGSNHTVFFDRASLPPGVDYNARIRQAILDSDLLVFAWSCREDGGNWHGAGPERHGGRDQAARSRSRGERSRVGQPSTRRMVI